VVVVSALLALFFAMSVAHEYDVSVKWVRVEENVYEFFAACMLDDGNLYMVGGSNENPNYPVIAVYDPATGDRVALIEFPEYNYSNFVSCFPDGNSMFLSMGDGVYVYDATSGTLSPLYLIPNPGESGAVGPLVLADSDYVYYFVHYGPGSPICLTVIKLDRYGNLVARRDFLDEDLCGTSFVSGFGGGFVDDGLVYIYVNTIENSCVVALSSDDLSVVREFNVSGVNSNYDGSMVLSGDTICLSRGDVLGCIDKNLDPATFRRVVTDCTYGSTLVYRVGDLVYYIRWGPVVDVYRDTGSSLEFVLSEDFSDVVSASFNSVSGPRVEYSSGVLYIPMRHSPCSGLGFCGTAYAFSLEYRIPTSLSVRLS